MQEINLVADHHYNTYVIYIVNQCSTLLFKVAKRNYIHLYPKAKS